MKNNIFVARIARGAAMTAATVFLSPNSETSAVSVHAVPEHICRAEIQPILEATKSDSTIAGQTITIHPWDREWTKAMEREFRRLLLDELKGSLNAKKEERLQYLNVMRDRLIAPMTSDEILLQMKRDRILEKIALTLQEYVEFKQAEGKKRPSA